MRHPTREEFDSGRADALEEVAAAVLRGLPLGWSVRELATGIGDTPARILLTYADAIFAYLPGGEGRIGFDVERWSPSAFERESWRSSAEAWGLEGTLEEHVARTTGRSRMVELPPLLVETKATLRGFEALDPESDEARDILSDTAPAVVQSTHGDTIYRFVTAADSSRSVMRKEPMAHAELTAAMARDGMRMPTEEEWEYACAAGSTLFPWGDHAPCDHYPVEKPLRADDPDRDPGFPPGWARHRSENRWGIYAAQDPYKPERVATDGIVRGGDGGGTICGSAGYFLGWLPLAPSYFEDEVCRSFVEDGWDEIDGLSRRVLPLS